MGRTGPGTRGSQNSIQRVGSRRRRTKVLDEYLSANEFRHSRHSTIEREFVDVMCQHRNRPFRQSPLRRFTAGTDLEVCLVLAAMLLDILSD
jgi:hypothetical protein